VRSAPGAAHEWRLVRLRGDVAEVHRNGDRWTAELVVAGVRVPISGLAGAGIPSTALTAGRTATIVGIVRRPYPSATDRRFAVVPRSGADLTVGPAADPSVRGSAAPAIGAASASSVPTSVTSPGGTVDLVDLPQHIGATVRVGGLVQAVDPAGFRLDDGTAVVAVRLQDAAADLAGSLVVGDALSATGRVERDGITGETVLTVVDPALLLLVGDLGEDVLGSSSADDAGDSPMPSGDPALGAGGLRMASLTDASLPTASALGLVLVTIASIAVTILRRRRSRRRFAERIAARLATVTVGAGSFPERLRDGPAERPAA
jgi:hypothetical protein